VPIRGAAHDIFSATGSLLVITPVVAGTAPNAAVLEGLFDLTPAEARIAGLIGSGIRPRAAAAQLGLTEDTLRTTLKRVLAKTGLRGQVELVSLLSGAAVRSNRSR
jgi:DNA-binding CsgD family transcriptional regulator